MSGVHSHSARYIVMGSPETEKDRDRDKGQHKVAIMYSFAVSKGSVTWNQWEACARDAGETAENTV